MSGEGRWRPKNWAAIRAFVIARDGGICWLCEQPGANSADHVVPRSKGGGHNVENLRAAHTVCNGRRGARTVLPMANISDRWR